jgi:hypothetical protein
MDDANIDVSISSKLSHNGEEWVKLTDNRIQIERFK